MCLSGRQLSNELTFDLDIWHDGLIMRVHIHDGKYSPYLKG